jgi:AraC-like DNA-binding protein/KaiC/GvpD/RAD55 family RecA-like ATPase
MRINNVLNRVKTGIPDLDDMLRGGFFEGSLILVIGPAGVGKTILGMRFLFEGLQKKEPGLFISLYNHPERILQRLNTLNMDFTKFLEDNTLHFFHLPIMDLRIEEKIDKIKRLISRYHIKRVVIDTLCSYLKDKDRNLNLIYSLIDLIYEKNLTAIITQRGGADINHLEEYYLPIEADVIIFLKHFELNSELKKSICVLKMTGVNYDTSIREYNISEDGISILKHFEGKEGILTGRPYKSEISFVFSGITERTKEFHESLIKRFNESNKEIFVKPSIIMAQISRVEELRKPHTEIGLIYFDPYYLPILIKEGLIADIDDVVPDSIKDDLIDCAWKPYIYNGKLYGVAKNLEISLLFYRKDLLEKYKFEVPNNWHDIINISSTILKGENNPNLIGLGFVDSFDEMEVFNNMFLECLWNNDGNIYDNNGEVILSNKNGVETLQFIKDLIYVHKVIPIETLDSTKKWYGFAKFIEGNAIFLYCSSDMFLTLEEKRCKVKLNREVSYIPFPIGPCGNKVNPFLGGSVYVIPKNIKYPDSARQLLRFILMNTDTNIVLKDYPFPIRRSLYYDEDILKVRPYYKEFIKMFDNIRRREDIPNYSDILPILHNECLLVLRQEKKVKDALESIKVKILKLEKSDKYAPVIKEAIKFLENNYNKDLSLSDIAKAVNLSPSHFNRLFKENTGYSCINYLTNLRIKKAEQLLKNVKYNVSEVAYKVGYTDPLYFSRIFKKYIGVSPIDYKNRNISK